MLYRLRGSLFPHGGGGRIRTFEGVSRQIYSLLPLAAWVPLREKRAAYSDFRGPARQLIRARKLLGRAPLPLPGQGLKPDQYPNSSVLSIAQIAKSAAKPGARLPRTV